MTPPPSAANLDTFSANSSSKRERSSSGNAPSTGGNSERRYEWKRDTSNGRGASTGPSCAGTPFEMELVKGGAGPFPFVVAMLACLLDRVWSGFLSTSFSCKNSHAVHSRRIIKCLRHKNRTGLNTREDPCRDAAHDREYSDSSRSLTGTSSPSTGPPLSEV